MKHRSELGKFQDKVEKAFLENRENNLMERIWQKDHTVWKPHPDEISNRLGWLHSPETMRKAVQEIEHVVNDLRDSGFTHALLLGMGGSSLAPEVFRYTFGVKSGYLDLTVLDSTDPDAVLACEEKFRNKKTIYIISTKSGGTVETISFLKYFYGVITKREGRSAAGNYFMAVTDPGSGLEQLAKTLNFRKIFLNDPNIGGRFSALSYFGLVAAAIVGVEIDLLLKSAESMAKETKNREGNNTPLWLGTAMGIMAGEGLDKISLVLSPKLRFLGSWIEQLIAESTGKEGKGILPVDGETLAFAQSYSADRLFIFLRIKDEKENAGFLSDLSNAGHPWISLELDDIYALGGEFFRWEVATSIACKYLDINPFNQPNVEAAKIRAKEMMSAYLQTGALPEQVPVLETDLYRVYAQESIHTIEDILPNLLTNCQSGAFGTYLSIQAYLQPLETYMELMQKIRCAVQKKYRIATTAGFGPRYLHSTGQLHKGDRGNGVFLQLLAANSRDAGIPDTAGETKTSISFAVLKTAQARGDREALVSGGRKVITLDLGNAIEAGINKLLKGLSV